MEFPSLILYSTANIPCINSVIMAAFVFHLLQFFSFICTLGWTLLLNSAPRLWGWQYSVQTKCFAQGSYLDFQEHALKRISTNFIGKLSLVWRNHAIEFFFLFFLFRDSIKFFSWPPRSSFCSIISSSFPVLWNYPQFPKHFNFRLPTVPNPPSFPSYYIAKAHALFPFLQI